MFLHGVDSSCGVRVWCACFCSLLLLQFDPGIFFFLPFSSSFVQKEEGLWTRLAAVGDKKDLMARRERSLQNVRELSQEVLRNSYYWAVIDILDNLWFIIPSSELLVQFFLLLLDVTSKSSLYQTLIMRFFFSF